MDRQSEENYLDELLNSVSREEKHKELVKNVEDFGRELKEAVSSESVGKYTEIRTSPKAEMKTRIKMSPKAEAEYLMEFEQELEGDDYDDFLKDFEENNIQPEDRLEASDMDMTEENALMSMLGDDIGDSVEEIPEIQAEAPKTGMREEISLEELALSGILAEEISMDEPDLGANSDAAPTDAIDLSQMGEEDLISLLAGAEDLSDIGELLSQNDNEVPIDSEDSFAAFAASEMSGQIQEVSAKNKEEKTSKGGFWAKLMSLLFGKEEEEETESVSLNTDSAPGVEILSDENAQILAAFAEVENAENAADKGEAKKEKKKKEPKAKKPAKAKAQKTPKPKKAKEKDNTPPLPKGPVALVCLLAASIFVLVFFGPELIGYSSAMSKAKDYYKMGHYTEAAEQISGLVIKNEDVMFYGKIATLAAVDSQISEYEIFMKNDRKAEALDSLISAAGRVEVNDDNTLTFDCADEMGVLKDGITVELQEQFNLTYEEAIELYQLTETDRDKYTIELNKVMVDLGIITE